MTCGAPLQLGDEDQMTAEAMIPDGFVPYSEPSPFLDRIGPLY